MKLAHLAGIQTFVTGGTGGVHRDGQNSMDISADLQELAKTPVVVVSAGIKSILDIPRTLEVLETLGVPTVTYQSDEFPAFFSPSSGVKAPARVDSVQEIARAYRASLDLGLNCGLLVAVPNQDPAGERTEHAIQEAIADAAQLGIQGRDVTPYILQAVASKTGQDFHTGISFSRCFTLPYLLSFRWG
jgi:pseudouridine-5'-phosphate glycosidase